MQEQIYQMKKEGRIIRMIFGGISFMAGTALWTVPFYVSPSFMVVNFNSVMQNGFIGVGLMILGLILLLPIIFRGIKCKEEEMK